MGGHEVKSWEAVSSGARRFLPSVVFSVISLLCSSPVPALPVPVLLNTLINSTIFAA